MLRINSFSHDNKQVPLIIPDELNDGDNTFTVIVGKNGVGKSRLLSDMVNAYIRSDRIPSQRDKIHDLCFDDMVEHRVIAVSTSPFDKFRLAPRSNNKDFIVRTNYRYVGMRSGPFGASAVSLISSATKGIIGLFIEKENNDRFIDVFKTIGLSPEVQLLFTPTFRSRRYLKDNETEKSDASYKGLEWLNDYGIEVDYRYLDKLMELSEGDVQRIRSALEKVRDSGDFKKTMSLSLDFAHAEVFRYNKNEYNNVDIIASINTLLDFNLITLMDMRLHKVDYGHMSLRQASSGEQCMLVILLGIAGNISDNSLVFIDEPEISLHPKWQEDFMSLLVKSFSKYKSCQFFIATHSPQMVSNLSNKNCFVTTMTSNKIFPSSYFYNMSSDFQLAEIFDAPGPKNEYMNRLAFTLLSKVKNKRSVSKENSDLLIKLLAMSETLDSDDPTYELVKSVEEVVKHYATDNKHY